MLAHFKWSDPHLVIRAAEGVTRRVCEEIRRDAVTSMSDAGTGRTYNRRGRSHRASAPGKPPAVDTGRLKQSIHVRINVTAARAVGEVGTNVHYAPHLEYGTTRMQARPFLGPALEKARRKWR